MSRKDESAEDKAKSISDILDIASGHIQQSSLSAIHPQVT